MTSLRKFSSDTDSVNEAWSVKAVKVLKGSDLFPKPSLPINKSVPNLECFFVRKRVVSNEQKDKDD